MLAVLVLVQTLLHLDERAGYLYMTYPGFPVGAGAGADGYVSWLEGHPTYEESWQFARQAALYTGADTDLSTGDHDARAGYAYLGALLARPLGYLGGFVALNIVLWYVAALATWYLARRLLGAEVPAFAAALLAAAGQGFVFMASTPMSYAAGYAWGAVLLALALRWRLFGWQSSGRRWLLWGWLCGVAGLFYFSHIVLVGTAWLFGTRRTPLRHLLAATVCALAVPASWYLVGHFLIGLRFQDTTAGDLSGQVRWLAQMTLRMPLLLPSEAGQGSLRALVGGFHFPVLALALVGAARAAPRRRQWYLAVALCGLGPVLVLHMLPVTQRYGYLAYPAAYIAAVEGAWWLTGLARVWLGRAAAPCSPAGVGDELVRAGVKTSGWTWATLALLAGIQLFQANADLWGIYRFALAFGGP